MTPAERVLAAACSLTTGSTQEALAVGAVVRTAFRLDAVIPGVACREAVEVARALGMTPPHPDVVLDAAVRFAAAHRALIEET